MLLESRLHDLGIKAVRTRGKLPEDYDRDDWRLQTMFKRTPGAVPCHFGQVSIMEQAFKIGKHAFVMEDVLVIAEDFHERIAYIEKFIKTHEWDIIWLNATFHINPPHWHNGTNPLLRESNLGRDAELTDDPRMIRTYGCFSTHAYIVRDKSIEKVLRFLDDHLHTSIGIDYLMIKMQPQIFSYSFVPGIIKQYNNKSNIGDGWTMYENFSKLNGTIENSRYWWQNKASDFDPLTFDWKEATL